MTDILRRTDVQFLFAHDGKNAERYELEQQTAADPPEWTVIATAGPDALQTTGDDAGAVLLTKSFDVDGDVTVRGKVASIETSETTNAVTLTAKELNQPGPLRVRFEGTIIIGA